MVTVFYPIDTDSGMVKRLSTDYADYTDLEPANKVAKQSNPLSSFKSV
jgi:hypothetical protein